MARTQKIFVAFVIFVVLAASGWGLWSWWFGDERAVKRRLAAIAETISLASHDSDLARLARIVQLRVYLAEDIRVRWGDAREIESRDAVLALAGRWVPPSSGILVEFVDVQVAVSEDANTAQVHLIANVSGVDPLSGEPTLDTREVQVAMVKRDGVWVVASADAMEAPASLASTTAVDTLAR